MALMQTEDATQNTEDQFAFGTLIRTWRTTAHPKIMQSRLLKSLPDLTSSMFSRLEDGTNAPRFDQLTAIYRAFIQVGIKPSPEQRHQFAKRARARLAMQKTHKDYHSDEEWSELLLELARIDGSINDAPDAMNKTRPILAETRHLIDLSNLHKHLLHLLDTKTPKKLIVLRGPAGIGKTSQLMWLADHLYHHTVQSTLATFCDLCISDRYPTPEDALRVFIGTALTDLGNPLTQLPTFSLDDLTTYLLELLQDRAQPVTFLIDHAECLFDQTTIAPCWEQFVSRFLKAQHSAKIILTTKLWHGWYRGEQRLVEEVAVPELSREQSTQLLINLGLDMIPGDLRQEIYEKVGGVPLSLEWIAAIVKRPLSISDWDHYEIDDSNEQDQATSKVFSMTLAVQQLLSEPHVFGGKLTDAVAPLLQRLLKFHELSDEARSLLRILAVARIPLAKPALVVICREGMGPRTIEELRQASLLVAYTKRVQLLPMVGAAIWRDLSIQETRDYEERLINAYIAWLREGNCSMREAGNIVTDLSALLLKHSRFFDAAQLLIRYGWLSFNLGHAVRLASIASEATQQYKQTHTEYGTPEEGLCGQLLLYHFLSPYLTEKINAKKRVQDLLAIQKATHTSNITLQPIIEVYVTRILVAYKIGDRAFEEAKNYFETTSARMAPYLSKDPDLRVAILELHALLLAKWSDFAKEQSKLLNAEVYRTQAIHLYQESSRILSIYQHSSGLDGCLIKKRLAKILTNLGYQLDLVERYEEALPVLDQSIALKEQGFVEPGSLAASYGEKSQALASLGYLEEALRYDALALADIERLANAGDTSSQEERWIYLVNRACLYLLLQRVDEAEQLLRLAKPNIQPTRGMFIMIAEETLQEIEEWRREAAATYYQRDWRWAKRLRDALSFNAFWWLAHAGPFTTEEQQEWDELIERASNDEEQKRLEAIISASRQREIEDAITTEREPLFHYPAIPIGEVYARIQQLLDLNADIEQQEPNKTIKNLYLKTIQERLCFLRLIEAAYNQDRDAFHEQNQGVHPVPTGDELNYALNQVKSLIRQGLKEPRTQKASQNVLTLMQEQLLLPTNLSEYAGENDAQLSKPLSPAGDQRMVSAQTVQYFLDASLQECGINEWKVVRDKNANVTRVESASRLLILQDRQYSLDEIVVDLFPNEVLHHIGDAIVGERSLLGLLSIGGADYMSISEGRALYHEIQTTQSLGRAFDDSKVWLGMLSAGLACGVLTPPQSFLSLYKFLKAFLILYRLIRRPDQDEATAEEKAHDVAITLCLRTFRGVPHLEIPGACYSKDVCYLRGLLLIVQAAKDDPTILDRLAVGRISLSDLHAVESLGVVPPLQPLRKFADQKNLEECVLSFEEKKGA